MIQLFRKLIPTFRDHPLAGKIDTDRHKQFMKEALPHLIGGIVTGLLVYFIYQDFMSTGDLLLWFCTQIILLTCTICFYLIFYKNPDFLSADQWTRIIFIVSLLWGIAWAMPPWIMMGTADAEYVAALLVVIVAMAIAPAPAMVYYPIGYTVYMTLPLASLFTRLLTMDFSIWLNLFVPFFWITALTYGWGLHQTLIDSIRLRLEIDESRNEAENANLAKSKFLAAASHDLRQPLQAINLFLTALKEKLKIPNDEKLMLSLESSVESMSELLNSLLDVSKLDAEAITPQPKDICVQASLKKTLNEYQALAENQGLSFTVQTDSSPVYADPVLLNRVIGNLMSNAVRYTTQGNITFSTHACGDEVTLSVRDTGMGIPDAEQENIFTEFHQLDNPERDQKKGLGLGLAIVRRLCTLQNWKLTLESGEHQGSCFSIVVPIGNASNINHQQESTIGQTDFSQANILVIEDDDSIRQALTTLFSGWNCNVESFPDSGSTVAFLKRSSWKPDIILSDFRLQHEETGIDAIRKAREVCGEEVYAFLMTGDTDPLRIQQAKESGLVVIHKPVKAAILRNVLLRALQQS